MNSETMNGTIRSMLGTMLQHLSALPVHMLRQVFFGSFFVCFFVAVFRRSFVVSRRHFFAVLAPKGAPK